MSKLKLLRPSLEISIEKIATAGDRDRLTQLDRMGTDVFVKELRVALADGRIDLAVHSLKDVPTDTPPGAGADCSSRKGGPQRRAGGPCAPG